MDEAFEDLNRPGTIVWAKLRGYPWWPGKIKSIDDCPKELANIARTQYRPDSMAIVYFFGSHDLYNSRLASVGNLVYLYSSLVPIDCLRSFKENWEQLRGKSTSVKFTLALKESRDPAKYKNFEKTAIMSNRGSPIKNATSVNEDGLVSKITGKRRGRPPKHRPSGESTSKPTKQPTITTRFDSEGNVTLEHLQYCRVKLQKILLRNPLKASEIPVGQKLIDALAEYRVPIEHLKTSRIAIVLQKALRRPALQEDVQYRQLLKVAESVLGNWKITLCQYQKELGLL